MAHAQNIPVRQWILGPAILTVAITFIRLIGELMNWSPAFFSRAGGGAGAVVGIVWLVPVFGIHFALKLLGIGDRPPGLLRAFGFLALGGVAPLLTGYIGYRLGMASLNLVLVVYFACLGAILIAKAGWPSLARLLWTYGLAARIPVMLVMLIAILGDWGTHYDVTPPDFSTLNPIIKWLLIGVFPQITFWMGFTVLCGMFFGLLTAFIHGKSGRTA
jgi:hypothetical protein